MDVHQGTNPRDRETEQPAGGGLSESFIALLKSGADRYPKPAGGGVSDAQVFPGASGGRILRLPTGFVATCQCGIVTGAMDYQRTDKATAARVLGRWLHHGCTVTPRFEQSWRVTVEACKCAH